MSEENVVINNREELVYYLTRWREAYKYDQLVSDDCYDHYRNLLKSHYPDDDFFKQDETFFEPLQKMVKEELPYILGSLDTNYDDDIEIWLNKHPSMKYVLSHKLDGVAVEIEYRQQNNSNLYQLANAWLRGNHYIGENITLKLQRTDTPLYIEVLENIGKDHDYKIFVKAEILLGCEPETILRDDGTPYKNKRNAVPGIIRRDDGKNLDKLYVKIHTWANCKYDNETLRMPLLKTIFGDKYTVPFQIVSRKDVISQSKEMIKDITQYDKDGIVVTVDDSPVENIKVPTTKIAYKFNKQFANTEVDHVEWNTSRTGDIVPLVYIKPVNLGGATINKTAGFNAKNIIDNKIGPNAIIKIVRSGDVIPYIEEVIGPSLLYNVPMYCPSCGVKTEWDSTKVHLICNNINCPAQVQKKIAHFFEELGLENFSERMLTTLNCNSVTEVLNLKKQDILKVDGWAEKSADDFLNRVKEIIKNITPEKLLSALGIENLGTSSSKLILENVSFENLINSLYDERKLSEMILTLINIKGLGEKKVSSIIKGLNQNRLFLSQFISNHNIQIKPKTGSLTGKSFCITGSLSKPRKDIEKWIESNGGSNTSINSCNYLVCNEVSESAKSIKAKKRGIPIITEEQLEKMNKI